MSSQILSERAAPPAAADAEKNVGLYVHIPFCVSKCSYCSFNSYPVATQTPGDYLKALHRQIAVMADHAWARQQVFATLYIGGGTPTIYDQDLLAELVATCLERFRFSPCPEVSVEANPNTVDRGKLTALREAGVNRLSIGVQSFSDKLLKAIGRSHSRTDAEAAIKAARQAGFDNISLDLMYGLPYQEIKDWQDTLATAVAHGPEHLSLYELMLEEGTALHRRAGAGGLAFPDEDALIAMEEAAGACLAEHGYQRYEISNFSRPGRQCGHNMNYWQNGSYLGLGAGAVSCLSGVRISNAAEPARFCALVHDNRPPFHDAECLPHAARFRETVIMGLRMLAGVSVDALQERFGFSVEEYYGPVLTELKAQGLVELKNGCLRLTGKGLPIANQVLSRLV